MSNTTGTYTFDPQIAEIFDEAFEIGAGMNPADVGRQHLESAFRSLKRMLNSEWSNIGIHRWSIQQAIEPMTIGKASFRLPIGAIDVMGMVLSRDGRVTEMYPISRQEYLIIVDKALKGRPDRFYVDRQAGNFNTTLSNATVYIWQCGQNTTDSIVYDYFRQIQDPGSLKNTLQIPARAVHAITLGLAASLAAKFKIEKFEGLMRWYRGPRWQEANAHGGALGEMLQEDRERSDIEINMDFTRRNSRS